ncbi:hypothetical protein GCM10023321_20480 [Pseudonocardia eucalypti]|uniref:Ribonuclease VapC n=1 Tax=Pseudonocardia eucalypti TaxID=648755 RepID=A0ABP9PX60_9PSEU|nr:putative nucleic acid-binding protein [Pseudonocardia eucalypti]
MIILDAAVVIAYLEGSDDAHHAAAVAVVDAHIGDETLGVSALNLAELLVRPVRRGNSEHALNLVLGNLDVTIVPILGSDALRLAEIRASTGLKLPDCCVLLAAERTGAGAIVTFDDRLRDAARGHGLIVLPQKT